MKKILIFILLISISVVPCLAYAESVPRPILYTYYRQIGWGDRIEIGYVDSNGDLWILNGNDVNLNWPYKPEEQIRYLGDTEFEYCGKLSHDDLFDLESLVYAVELFDFQSIPAACDAGIECAYAVRYDRDGNTEPILLGMSGDDMFENPDPNAQGLYFAAHKLFPNVTRYGLGMGPLGFIPVSITDFCQLGDLSGAKVKAFYMDCESGLREIDLSDGQQAQILYDVKNSVVTGKVSAVDITGGYRDYRFYHDDVFLGSISIYEGRLYRSDGMYTLESITN